jgi:serine/threonine-protein kinase
VDSLRSESISTGLLGQVLDGKYRIVRRLGEGGMGSVYEGENLRLGRRVAIKVIAPELAQNAEVGGRFRREAKVASSIANDHIVRIYDVDTDPQHGLYLVMELLRGEDLARRLKRERDLPVETACTIAYHMALGLDAVHAAHVIHRDLKPANVFLHEVADGTTVAKLVDFGISKTIDHVDAPAETALTRVGTVVGTLQYMSPEQARGGPLDARTDLWSLGCVLFELLAGRPAYPIAKSLEAAYKQLMVEAPPKLAPLAPWVPKEIVALVDGCMQHDPDLRIADAFTFAQRLAQALPNVELGGSVFKPETAPSLPPIEGDMTLVSSDAELDEIRKSSFRRGPLEETAARAKPPKTRVGAVAFDAEAPTRPSHDAIAPKAPPRPPPPKPKQAQQAQQPEARADAGAGEFDDERSLVARPSEIRALRRQLIEQEKQELGLPTASSAPPRFRTKTWPYLLALLVVVLAAVALVVARTR